MSGWLLRQMNRHAQPSRCAEVRAAEGIAEVERVAGIEDVVHPHNRRDGESRALGEAIVRLEVRHDLWPYAAGLDIDRVSARTLSDRLQFVLIKFNRCASSISERAGHAPALLLGAVAERRAERVALIMIGNL